MLLCFGRAMNTDRTEYCQLFLIKELNVFQQLNSETPNNIIFRFHVTVKFN